MTAARLALGIDAGGSGTRWILRSGAAPGAAGHEVGRGRVGPLSGLAFLEPPGSEARREAASAVARLAEDVAAAARAPEAAGASLGGVLAGVTGLSDGDEAAGELGALLSRELDVPPDRVRVWNDMALAYRCAFDPGRGVLIYAGTGSLAVHVPVAGPMLRAGGHGYLIDDAGGGFWIGRHALRTVLRHADRQGAPAEGALADAVYGALGTRSWPEIRRRVYRGGRREVAALVPAVRRALAAGDPDAARIVSVAGEELARLADVLLARLGHEQPVALAGGAAGLGAPLRKAVAAALPAGTHLRIAERTPVETAARLAVRRP
jgi:N-acetylglucosamine kinase-like BadF-type ATPase